MSPAVGKRRCNGGGSGWPGCFDPKRRKGPRRVWRADFVQGSDSDSGSYRRFPRLLAGTRARCCCCSRRLPAARGWSPAAPPSSPRSPGQCYSARRIDSILRSAVAYGIRVLVREAPHDAHKNGTPRRAPSPTPLRSEKPYVRSAPVRPPPAATCRGTFSRSRAHAASNAPRFRPPPPRVATRAGAFLPPHFASRRVPQGGWSFPRVRGLRSRAGGHLRPAGARSGSRWRRSRTRLPSQKQGGAGGSSLVRGADLAGDASTRTAHNIKR